MDAIAGALLGGSSVAFIQGAWTFWGNRKAVPEIAESKLLDFWIKEVGKAKEEMTIELNGIRKSFEEREKQSNSNYQHEMNRFHETAQSDKVSGEMIINNLNSEIRRLIEQLGANQIDNQKELTKLKDEFYTQILQMEREKSSFLQDMMTRYERLCETLKGDTHGNTNSRSGNQSGSSSNP